MLQVKKTKIRGMEVFQVVKNDLVIFQAMSLNGIRNWLLSQKAGV